MDKSGYFRGSTADCSRLEPFRVSRTSSIMASPEDYSCKAGGYRRGERIRVANNACFDMTTGLPMTVTRHLQVGQPPLPAVYQIEAMDSQAHGRVTILSLLHAQISTPLQHLAIRNTVAGMNLEEMEAIAKGLEAHLSVMKEEIEIKKLSQDEEEKLKEEERKATEKRQREDKERFDMGVELGRREAELYHQKQQLAREKLEAEAENLKLKEDLERQRFAIRERAQEKFKAMSSKRKAENDADRAQVKREKN